MHRQLDDRTLVSGQIHPDDVPALKKLGVTLIVNNRPDGEDEGQPTSAEIEAAAAAAGIGYRHVPIARGKQGAVSRPPYVVLMNLCPCVDRCATLRRLDASF